MIAAVALSTACASEVTNGGAASGPGPTGPGGGGGGAQGGGGAGGRPTTVSGPGGQGGGSGAECGGFAGQTCPADEYCDYPDNDCGATDGAGVCKKRPGGCPETEIYSPTCGCDGKIHGNECDANAAGVDVNDLGSCPAPQGMFACGHTFCDVGQTYCEVQTSDVGGIPNNYACKLLPKSCGSAPSCACLAGELCGKNCKQIAPGALEAVCPGG
jgi:hypothetical protein